MKFAIGIMTGTSVDALDVSLIELTPSFKTVRLDAFLSEPFDKEFRDKILRNSNPETSSVEEICDLNVELARFAAKAVHTLLKDVNIKREDISCIGFHGQNLWHNPENFATYQIGDGPTLAALTEIPVVNNFRTKDMARGGQGAPLVPYAHQILFQDQSHEKISVHNLGGISNLTYLSFKQKLAFDTGPANCLLDLISDKVFGQTYDRDGSLARSGTVNEELLKKFTKDSYFAKLPPKSTGRETYGEAYFKKWQRAVKSLEVSDEDFMATALELTVQSIKMAYEKFVLPHGLDKVILCGGGAENSFLVERLSAALPVPVETSEIYGYSPQTIESICFAILGYLGLEQKVNQIAGLTGSSKDSSLGQISYP